jgi:hypothetical protein
MLSHTIGPGVSIDVQNQAAKKFENQCATVVTQHLAYLAPNALIDCIAVTHMERRVG